MARLVVLSEGMKGRTYDLTVEKTTVGRVEDNAFQIAEQSVSSHHCEVLLQGGEVIVKDLNSTNGTFINGQKVATQGTLKSGQILRLGQIELRFESGEPGATAAASATPAPAPAPKKPEQSHTVTRGVQLNELDQGAKPANIAGNPAFSKKSNKGTIVFISVAVLVLVVVIGVILWAVVFSK
jgi:pSer/pThr/pTyr-binding forkhead associated (FHA) protein